jgi:SAM-dependent methyltransferase
MEKLKAEDVQGKGNVFGSAFPILYASEGPVEDGYARNSATCAVYADAHLARGLRGSRVLDLGCGYGTTTAALARFEPSHITAIDPSAEMIGLMRVVMEGTEDLDTWLRAQGADGLLKELYGPTLKYLQDRRTAFQKGTFIRHGGELKIERKGVFDLEHGDYPPFDVAVGNNMLHWPVNQMKEKEKINTREALLFVLGRIRRILRPYGTAVFMEPKDFMTFDGESERETDCTAHSMTTHPVFIAAHTRFGELLKKEFGIDWVVPKSTGLFPVTEFLGWCHAAGFEIQRFTHVEFMNQAEPLLWCACRFLIWLGKLTVSFEDKLRLARQVYEELDRELAAEDRKVPMFSQSFYVVLQKPG